MAEQYWRKRIPTNQSYRTSVLNVRFQQILSYLKQKYGSTGPEKPASPGLTSAQKKAIGQKILVQVDDLKGQLDDISEKIRVGGETLSKTMATLTTDLSGDLDDPAVQTSIKNNVELLKNEFGSLTIYVSLGETLYWIDQQIDQVKSRKGLEKITDSVLADLQDLRARVVEIQRAVYSVAKNGGPIEELVKTAGKDLNDKTVQQELKENANKIQTAVDELSEGKAIGDLRSWVDKHRERVVIQWIDQKPYDRTELDVGARVPQPS